MSCKEYDPYTLPSFTNNKGHTAYLPSAAMLQDTYIALCDMNAAFITAINNNTKLLFGVRMMQALQSTRHELKYTIFLLSHLIYSLPVISHFLLLEYLG